MTDQRNMQVTGSVKFSVVAGLLLRGELRRVLNKMVADLKFAFPKSSCHMTESKSFLDSEFMFVGTNLPQSAIDAIIEMQRHIEEASTRTVGSA